MTDVNIGRGVLEHRVLERKEGMNLPIALDNLSCVDVDDTLTHSSSDWDELGSGQPGGEVSIAQCLGEPDRDRIRDLAPEINDKLNRRVGRTDKQYVSTLIGDWLKERDRLVCDATDDVDPIPYVLLDDHSTAMMDTGSARFRLAIHEAGINPTESVFAWIVADLRARCIRDGTRVKVVHGSVCKEGTLYISSGPGKMVVVRQRDDRDLVFEEKQNGTDGILFATDGCFPAWTPDEQMAPLSSLRAFNPVLESPSEAPMYSPTAQHGLMTAWIICAIVGIRPLPILTPLGQKGSGKSTTAKAILKLLHGDTADVATVPNTQSDFAACASSLGVYAIDNLDGNPSPWLPDALAQTTTGGYLQERKKYTNAEIFKKQLISALIVTTRSGHFANRSDISERVLPLFFGERISYRHSENGILNEVLENRDSVLTWLACKGLEVISGTDNTRDVNIRFTEFGRAVLQLYPTDGAEMLDGLTKAQSLSVSDVDPFLAAILNFKQGTITGRATEIMRKLEAHGAIIPFQGGGKTIARKLREFKPTLEMSGWTVRETASHGSTEFTIRPPCNP